MNLFLFASVSLLLLLMPGPNVMYVITRSVDQGRKSGLISVLGIQIGNFSHAFAAAMGLSAILVSSAIAFNLVRYLGAAYLIYLGVRKLLTPEKTVTETVAPDKLRRIFSQGVVVSVLNPKTALFFFAFLPQFVTLNSESVTLQILFLGMVFVMLATCTDSLYALVAGTAGNWLRGNLKYLRFQRYFSGSVYIGLGLTAAFSGGKKK